MSAVGGSKEMADDEAAMPDGHVQCTLPKPGLENDL